MCKWYEVENVERETMNTGDLRSQIENSGRSYPLLTNCYLLRHEGRPST